ncbi:MAG: hypothetical protein PHO10_02990 [Gemmiger sp.]|nr:hypothetical protein [Gemmiger sp.]
MKKFAQKMVEGLSYIFFNCLVCYIPVWTLRKLLYRLFGMKISEGAWIGLGTKVVHPWKISIGAHTAVNEYGYLDGRGGLTIGNNVSISIYTVILTASHNSRSAGFVYYTKPVVIEDNAWLGVRCVVLEGSYIEHGAIVAANSTLRGRAEADCLYSGVPATKIRERGLEGAYTLGWSPFFH